MSKQPKQPTAEETVNALVLESRVLENTYNELTARQNILERALIESRAALDAIKGLAEGSSKEVLTQIGGGAILRSAPPSIDKVMLGVGAGIVIEKPRAEAVAILEERTKEYERTLMSIVNQRNEIAERLESDRQVLNTILSQSQE